MMLPNRFSIIIAMFSLMLHACAYTQDITGLDANNKNTPQNRTIILATTTSTQDSGLLDYLLPIFERKTGFSVKTIAVGTGQALQMGKEGNADVLLVHAPQQELAFMAEGFGSERYLVMHNDFVIVGPPDDPANISDAIDVKAAFSRIYHSKSLFVSRGDESGTYHKEMEIWNQADLVPSGDWYEETGQGMAATLRIASQKNAYTISDRATFLANQDLIDLEILLESDASLLNIYHVIVVDPEKWPKVNLEGAEAFAKFLIAPETQVLIGQFGVEEYGEPLFFPDAEKTEPDLRRLNHGSDLGRNY